MSHSPTINPLKRTILTSAVLTVLVLGPALAQAQTAADPLFRYQWHLQNVGQQVIADTRPVAGIDLDVDEAHKANIRGKGVLVGIVDDGLEIRHEDLAANVRQGGSKNFYDGSNDPTPQNPNDEHGTSVGGIVGAVGWNGKGGRGVAPEAQLVAFNFLSTDGDTNQKNQDDHILYGWGDGKEAKAVQVFNNSWGSAPSAYPAISTTEVASWEKLTNSTRSGKGGVYTKAAGNGFDSFYVQQFFGPVDACEANTKRLRVPCTSANTDAFNNFTGIITVAAVNAKGVRSSYSSSGSAVWVAGLGGEFGYQARYKPGLIASRYDPAIVTTDLTGCAAGGNANRADGSVYNALDTSASTIDASCNYWARMNGTSAATPTVSGVASLILQVNPNLTYRDVKYILATTARKIDPNYAAATYNDVVIDQGWVTNKAGRAFSNWYGFGLIDAAAAITKAKSFVSLPTRIDSGWLSSTGASQAIGGDAQPAVRSVNVTTDAKVEAVQVSFETTHKTPKNLRATLVSPSGTQSIILTPFATLADITSGTGFTVPLTSSNAFLDESSGGTWTLKLADVVNGRSVGELRNFKLRVVGH